MVGFLIGLLFGIILVIIPAYMIISESEEQRIHEARYNERLKRLNDMQQELLETYYERAKGE